MLIPFVVFKKIRVLNINFILIIEDLNKKDEMISIE
jgi:hypothetical protein